MPDRIIARSHDPSWYRQEAGLLRQKAAQVTDSAELRDSYLALSLEYERLARLLEMSQSRS
jgi:hypothetical protein